MSDFDIEDMGVGGCIFIALGVAGLLFFGTWLFMLGWNWLMPDVFGLPELTFWQSMLLIAIVRTLTTGYSSSGSSK